MSVNTFSKRTEIDLRSILVWTAPNKTKSNGSERIRALVDLEIVSK